LKASVSWLKEFVDFNLSPKELAHTLTMSGFEVEGLNEVGDDTILDINITPNRPDCLSITGIARELAAILELPLKTISAEIQKEEGRGPDVEINGPHLCRRYASRLVLGVKPGPSPEWVVKRLEAHGFRTSCNIVDITNYVLLEMGQPLHAFDLDKLAGPRIAVKTAGEERKFRALDDEERILNNDTLLIWDEEKPVALAGVMGGLNTEVSSSTMNILLESAYFNPVSVRRTSRSLNIKTESSYRFERGVDINSVVSALDRATRMIVEIAGGKVSHLTDMYPDPFVSKQIRVRIEKINSLLGIDIEESFIRKTLSNLGFEIEREGDELIVTPPGFRRDVRRDVDIIEDIARLYGYGKIPTTLPDIRMRPAPVNKQQDVIKVIKNSMTGSGFNEAINYSFLNPDTLDRLNIPPDDVRRNLISIKNPLRKEDSAMRTTLIPALLGNVGLNMNRGERDIRFFEVSKVFLSSDEGLPHEVIQLAAIFSKDAALSLWKDRHEGFYDAKGALEKLLGDLKTGQYSFKADRPEPYLHPGKSCSIFMDGKKIGSIGVLHPNVMEAFDLRGDITIFEIDHIEKLPAILAAKTTFVPLPKFPCVERDIAIIVSKDITVEQAGVAISGITSDLVEAVSLFDIYTGKPVPEDKKSLAFSVRYRAADRTLTDPEVDTLHSRIIEQLKNVLNANLRS